MFSEDLQYLCLAHRGRCCYVLTSVSVGQAEPSQQDCTLDHGRSVDRQDSQHTHFYWSAVPLPHHTLITSLLGFQNSSLNKGKPAALTHITDILKDWKLYG